MVDADKDGTLDYSKLDKSTLADSLKTKRPEEIKAIVQAKAAERAAIQKQITELTTQREKFIAEEKKRMANNKQEAT